MRRAIVAVALALLLVGPATAVGAVDCSSYPSPNCTAQQFQATVRQELGNSLADAVAIQQELAFALDDNRHEQDALNQQVSDSEARLADLDAELTRLQGEIDTTTARISLERAELSALARTLAGEPQSLLVLAVRSRDLGEALTRTSDLIAAGGRARALKAGLETNLAKLNADLDAQRQARDAEAAVRQDLVDKTERLGELAGQGESIRGQLDAAISRVQTELSALPGQSPEVAANIRAELLTSTASAIAAAQGDIWAQVMAWRQLNLPPPPDHPIPSSASDFRLAWPVDNPYVTQGFGPSTLALEPPFGPYPHFHTGIDLADRPGTPILAAHAGVVSLVGTNPGGYGNYIIVVHDQGYATLYGHLLRPLVLAGAVVPQGRIIGLMGSTGLSTGSHLHFELRLNGLPKDPSLFLPPLPGSGN